MAAPTLWAPFFWFFLLEIPHSHKNSSFLGRGGFWAFLERGGGGSANFIMGAGSFSDQLPSLLARLGPRCQRRLGSQLFASSWLRRHPLTLAGQNRQSPIASVQRKRSTLANHSAAPCGTNERQSRDSNRSTTNARSMRTTFCGLGRDMTTNER